MKRPNRLTGYCDGVKGSKCPLELCACSWGTAALRCTLQCGLGALGFRVAGGVMFWELLNPGFLTFPSLRGFFDPSFLVCSLVTWS